MYKLKLGISIKLFDDFEEKVIEASKLGFDSVDLDLAVYYGEKERQYSHFLVNVPKAFKIIEKNGLICNAVHLSYGPLMDFSNPKKSERVEILEYAKKILSLLNPYDFSFYVFHGSSEITKKIGRKRRISALKKSLPILVKYAAKPLCLEDLPRLCLCNTSDELISIVDGCKRLFVCYDTNHLLNESSEEAILKLGNRIKTLHISDYDYVNERHWLPKQGKIDWIKLIGNLEKIGYSGVFNYELRNDFSEVKNNYDELFKEYNK